jgi:hypothetical protein
MATPINVSEDSTIYYVDITAGSQFKGKSWDLDEYNRQTEYKHDKKTRKNIGAIRQRINVLKNEVCMKYGKGRRKLCFTNYEGMVSLTTACQQADKDMKEIDPTLFCIPEFMEQTFKQLNSQNMFTLMQQQLNEQINKRILDKVEKDIENATVRDKDGKVIKVKPIGKRTRDALIKAVEGVKAINILNDPTVNARIETLLERMRTETLVPMRDELLAYIEDIQGAENLEITPDEIPSQPATAATGMKPDKDLDEDKYQAKPVNVEEIMSEDLI